MKSGNDVSTGAVNDVGIERIRSYVAVFDHSDVVPVAIRHRAIVAAARDTHRAAFLLSGANLVRESGGDTDMIELCCGLVEPRAPGSTPVHRDNGPLIAHQRQRVGVVR